MLKPPVFPDLATLVVDESLYIRRVLRDMLMRGGIRRVQEASDGAEALGSLVETKPDLVILDWDLAILTGEEVIRLTRDFTTSPCPTIPILLMMAQPRKDRVERAVRLGVNEIVAKPFSPNTIWMHLDEVVNRPRPYKMGKTLLVPTARVSQASLLAV